MRSCFSHKEFLLLLAAPLPNKCPQNVKLFLKGFGKLFWETFFQFTKHLLFWLWNPTKHCTPHYLKNIHFITTELKGKTGPIAIQIWAPWLSAYSVNLNVEFFSIKYSRNPQQNWSYCSSLAPCQKFIFTNPAPTS